MNTTIVTAIVIGVVAAVVVMAFLRFRSRRGRPAPLVFRIPKWLILLASYFGLLNFGAPLVRLLVAFFELAGGSASQAFSVTPMLSAAVMFPNYLLPSLVIGGWLALAGWAYRHDRAREQTATDDFTGDNLLARYGYRINEVVLAIPVKPEWTDREVEQFVEAMRQRIAGQIQSRFAALGVEVTGAVRITDQDRPSDQRSFLKVVSRSARGSQVSHFIHYAIAGKYVVAHYLSHLRGPHRWEDVVDFVITSPLSVWFWGVPWLQNQHSIIAAISRDVSNNSYDRFDLTTYFVASKSVLIDETAKFLEERGLLTEELKQIIYNNINNSQNISITGSHHVQLGNVRNTMRNPAPNPQHSRSGD